MTEKTLSPTTGNVMRLYDMGLSYEEVGARVGVTRSRVHQILKKAGVPARTPAQRKSERDTFLGVTITPLAKQLLEEDADNRNMSVSALVAEVLDAHVYQRTVQLPDGKKKPQPAWKIQQERTKLTAALKRMVWAESDSEMVKAARQAKEAAEALDQMGRLD